MKNYFARQCSVTQKGMNEGWVWCDGAFYTSTLEITLKECRKDREHILEYVKEFSKNKLDLLNEIQNHEEYHELLEAIKRAENNTETDEDLLLIGYQLDYVYYTEWECEEDMEYQEIDGELTEIIN